MMHAGGERCNLTPHTPSRSGQSTSPAPGVAAPDPAYERITVVSVSVSRMPRQVSRSRRSQAWSAGLPSCRGRGRGDRSFRWLRQGHQWVISSPRSSVVHHPSPSLHVIHTISPSVTKIFAPVGAVSIGRHLFSLIPTPRQSTRPAPCGHLRLSLPPLYVRRSTP